jgi:hypothetical protein
MCSANKDFTTADISLRVAKTFLILLSNVLKGKSTTPDDCELLLVFAARVSQEKFG